MIVDLCLVTYPGDFQWLPYLFRSITKYVTGYRRLMVLIEDGVPEPEGMPSTAVVVRRRSYYDAFPGKNRQHASAIGAVIERLRSFEHTDADLISCFDSDCVFARLTDYQTDEYVIPSRPRILWRKWEEAGLAICWKPKAEATLGYEPTRETMCGYPMTYPRDVLADFWQFVGGAERLLTFWTEFTDWNALGNWALDHRADRFTAQHLSEFHASGIQGCVRQNWSHYDVNNTDIQAEFRKLGLT
jgi:hypothetical protein